MIEIESAFHKPFSPILLVCVLGHTKGELGSLDLPLGTEVAELIHELGIRMRIFASRQCSDCARAS